MAKTPTLCVRKFCIDCCGGSKPDVKTCGGDKPIMGGDYPNCPLYPYRFGKNRVSVKTLRKHCLMCMSNSKSGVRECPSTQCAIWPFRLGTNPNYGTKDRKLKSKVAKKLGLAELGLKSKQKGVD
jgi:hypothetical protein